MYHIGRKLLFLPYLPCCMYSCCSDSSRAAAGNALTLFCSGSIGWSAGRPPAAARFSSWLPSSGDDNPGWRITFCRHIQECWWCNTAGWVVTALMSALYCGGWAINTFVHAETQSTTFGQSRRQAVWTGLYIQRRERPIRQCLPSTRTEPMTTIVFSLASFSYIISRMFTNRTKTLSPDAAFRYHHPSRLATIQQLNAFPSNISFSVKVAVAGLEIQTLVFLLILLGHHHLSGPVYLISSFGSAVFSCFCAKAGYGARSSSPD